MAAEGVKRGVVGTVGEIFEERGKRYQRRNVRRRRAKLLDHGVGFFRRVQYGLAYRAHFFEQAVINFAEVREPVAGLGGELLAAFERFYLGADLFCEFFQRVEIIFLCFKIILFDGI